ncbi:MAG: hypothetical protein SFV54_19575 [Bryobacteraceae bacterium]|nr:hypothetical protein [Bryobacteraceae bacterium]
MPKSKAPGRLIAVEGTRQSDLMEAGAEVLRAADGARTRGGVSVWDASGIFFELSRSTDTAAVPSAKTLLLLYASDLVFRLRWEIQPALNQGLTVVAAPYLQTAFAAGVAAGVPKQWIANLFDFAPRPDATFRTREKDGYAGWTGKRKGGFCEFVCASLGSLSDKVDQAELRARMVAYLDKLERGSQYRTVTPKVLKKVAAR